MSRQAEATNSTISAEQIARIRQAIRSTCPNGSRHRLLSLTREELAALSEMLADAEARIAERETIQSLLEACKEAVFAFECEVPQGNAAIAVLRAAIVEAMNERLVEDEVRRVEDEAENDQHANNSAGWLEEGTIQVVLEYAGPAEPLVYEEDS